MNTLKNIFIAIALIASFQGLAECRYVIEDDAVKMVKGQVITVDVGKSELVMQWFNEFGQLAGEQMVLRVPDGTPIMKGTDSGLGLMDIERGDRIVVKYRDDTSGIAEALLITVELSD